MPAEYLLNRQFENIGDAKCKGKRGIITALFNGIDALARDAKPVGKVLLRPIALGAQDFEAVLHAAPHVPKVMRFTAAPTASPPNQMIVYQ